MTGEQIARWSSCYLHDARMVTDHNRAMYALALRPMLKRQPSTLADTHELWDCLHTANSVAIPFAFSAEAAVLHGKKASLTDAAPTTPARLLKFAFGKTSEDQRSTIRQAFGLSGDYAFVGTLYANSGAHDEIIVPVEKKRVIKLNLVEPLRHLDPAF